MDNPTVDQDQSEGNEEEQSTEEVEEIERSGMVETTDDWPLTIEGMSNSFALSLLWLDKMCGITPSSKRGQLIYMLAMLAIPLVPIFALVTQNVVLLNNIIIRKADLVESDISVEKSEEFSNFISALQQERSAALMTLFLRENFNSETEKINFDIESLRRKTDVALENITEWRAFTGENMFRSKLRFVNNNVYMYIQEYRIRGVPKKGEVVLRLM